MYPDASWPNIRGKIACINKQVVTYTQNLTSSQNSNCLKSETKVGKVIYIYIVGQLYFQLHQGKKYGMLLRVSVLTDWGLIHKLPVHAILLKRYGSWNFKKIKINEGYNFKIKTLGPAFSPLKIVWWLLPSCIGEVAKCTSLILYLKPPVR